MKIKRIVFAIALVAGLASSIHLFAETAPGGGGLTCTGSGQECATTADGTVFYKGLDQ